MTNDICHSCITKCSSLGWLDTTFWPKSKVRFGLVKVNTTQIPPPPLALGIEHLALRGSKLLTRVLFCHFDLIFPISICAMPHAMIFIRRQKNNEF